AMHQHIAVLFWCCADPKRRRFRVPLEKVRRLLKDDSISSNVAFAASRERDGFCIWRCYVSATDTVSSVTKARSITHEMLASPAQREWAERGQLSIAILAEEVSKVQSIRQAVQAKDGGEPSLAELVRVTAGLGPSTATIAASLRSLKIRRDSANV